MTNEIEILLDVEMTTRDGCVLRSDIFRPKGDGPFPVILSRTPYNKALAPINSDFARRLAERGYIAVLQDIRGVHASVGEHIWMFDADAQAMETLDGIDAVRWAAELPKSDGRVGAFGASYPAWLLWCVAGDLPEQLKTMFVAGMTTAVRDMHFGIFETARRLQWTYHQAAGARRRTGEGFPSTFEDANEHWTRHLRGKWLWTLPLRDIPEEVFGPLDGALRKYAGVHDKELWDFETAHRKLDIPVCNQTGWWDRLVRGTYHYDELMKQGDAKARDGHRLVIGPWPHSPNKLTTKTYPRSYGPASEGSFADMVADWHDTHLKGVRRDIAAGDPVQLFILNDNGWHGFQNWPPAEAEMRPLYLHSGGGANTIRGDGTLTWEAPGDEPSDSYAYDPADPVMSLMDENGQSAPVSQRPNELRRDVLIFQTEPLAEDLLVIGHVTGDLWAASSAVETDFLMRLIEVGDDGLAINLCQGILRSSYRDGYENPSPMTPDTPYRFKLDIGPTGILFRAGSRIRVDVTSSDFPAFDRNHNTGKDYWSDPELIVAKQTVFHDAARPSAINLPVVPVSALGI